MKKTVCIVGLGLIGGSLGMAIRKSGRSRVLGLTREQDKGNLAVKLKAVDYASRNIKSIIECSDIIFICYPIHLILPEINKIIQFVKPGTIITDVGSTKGFIVAQAEKLMPKGVFFVGGHPMAGKEVTGLEEAEADLFKGKTYVLTKTKSTDPAALKELQRLISGIGAKVVVMDPRDHDEAVGQISHMPIAVATSLVSSLMEAGSSIDDMVKLAASGFRDTTRVASGDPQLGADMFFTNKRAVLEALSRFRKSLSSIEKLIRTGDHQHLLNKLKNAKDFRDSMFQ